MSDTNKTQKDPARKLFFGLFIFPLVIAVGMAVLLCGAVLLTHERETPEMLIAAIKTGSPSKRWQKAFELSNELNRQPQGPRQESVMGEIIHILKDVEHTDAKTRGYMALALAYFDRPEAIRALRDCLSDESDDVRLYVLWALGKLKARESAVDIYPILRSESEPARKMAVYVLGVIGKREALVNIRPLLDDSAEEVRWNAALSMARLGNAEGLSVLKMMIDRENLSGGERSLTETDIESIMTNAARGLALIPDAESIKILRSVSRSDKSLKVRQAALDALEPQNKRLETA